jgi:hypothetical protein
LWIPFNPFLSSPLVERCCCCRHHHEQQLQWTTIQTIAQQELNKELSSLPWTMVGMAGFQEIHLKFGIKEQIY